MSALVVFLVAFPLAVSGVLLAVTKGTLRNAIVVVACVVVAAASLVTVVAFGNGEAIFFGLPGGLTPGHAILVVEVAIAIFVVVVSLQNGRVVAPVMALAQLGIALYLDLGGHLQEPDPQRLFWFDRLTMVMVLVIGVVGPLICIHALGYMRDYQRSNPQIGGRRTSFFFLLFLFLASMFGLVVSNDLQLLLVFWEITTLCSFLLIGYTRTKETVSYAFDALNMNLLGGL